MKTLALIIASLVIAHNTITVTVKDMQRIDGTIQFYKLPGHEDPKPFHGTITVGNLPTVTDAVAFRIVAGGLTYEGLIGQVTGSEFYEVEL